MALFILGAWYQRTTPYHAYSYVTGPSMRVATQLRFMLRARTPTNRSSSPIHAPATSRNFGLKGVRRHDSQVCVESDKSGNPWLFAQVAILGMAFQPQKDSALYGGQNFVPEILESRTANILRQMMANRYALFFSLEQIATETTQHSIRGGL